MSKLNNLQEYSNASLRRVSDEAIPNCTGRIAGCRTCIAALLIGGASFLNDVFFTGVRQLLPMECDKA